MKKGLLCSPFSFDRVFVAVIALVIDTAYVIVATRLILKTPKTICGIYFTRKI